jgi:hypothetical protein
MGPKWIWAIRTIPRYPRLDIIPSSGIRRGHRGLINVAIDEQHVALPKLYGAPAYARPPRPAAEVRRPLDPDDLPIEAVMTDEERDFAASLPAGAYAPGVDLHDGSTASPPELSLMPRPLSLRALAGRVLGQADN